MSTIQSGRYFQVLISEGVYWNGSRYNPITYHNGNDPCNDIDDFDSCGLKVAKDQNLFMFGRLIRPAGFGQSGLDKVSGSGLDLVASVSSSEINLGSLLSYTKSLFLAVIGSGLGVLFVLMPYVIGLIVIGSIVYFVYRAFRGYKY